MDETRKSRIWAQGATDQVGHRNYLAQLLPHMKACLDPGFELDFNTAVATGPARPHGIESK